jgi:hypothetical protein
MELRQVKTTSFNVGMNKDIDPRLVKDGVYVNAINARLNTHEGGLSFINNEPANFQCLSHPLALIGSVLLPSGKHILFLTDDFQSEIGIFDQHTCSYERKVKSTCLGFTRKHLIKGVARENFDCSESVYWTDGVNPRRHLNLSNIPYTYSVADDECKTKTFTSELDCDALLLDKKISYPQITIEFGTDGIIKNGAYQVAIAYSVNGQVATDWMGLTFPKKHFSHDKLPISLEIELSNLDLDFDEYALAVVYTQDGVTSVDRVGFYSTAQDKVTVSNVGKTAINNVLMTLDEIVIKRPVYNTAEDVVASPQHLLWTNPSTKPELDYQLDAMNIVPKWVAYKAPKDYYKKDGGLVGYMRDEVYAFAIQWLYLTGDWSPAYHIPGRKPKGRENKQVSGQDVYEKSGGVCDQEDLPYFFQVYNTARVLKRYPQPTIFCDPTIIAEGEMAYWQSSELYPDNENLYGTEKCTPVRHPKFPDSSVIHIHDNDLGKDSGMIILGVRFENIKKPSDSKIVGYRIVRSDRSGNKSIVAKGLLFNTGNYTDNGNKWMYPNYPYNDLRVDPFLSTTQTKFDTRERNYNQFGDFNQNKFTFHSPGTSFNKPQLGTELKIESEEVAEVKGSFNEVYKHPKYKFITNFSFGMAIAIARGYATLAVKGRKCVTAGTMPGGVDGLPRPFSYDVECETELMGKAGTPAGIILPVPDVAGLVVAYGYYFSLGLQTTLNIIRLVSNYQQFGYQYNSHGLYSGYRYPRLGQRRRRINYSQYLIPGNQDINGVKMNNFNRESSVYLELNQSIKNPQTKDNTRGTISTLGLCDNPTNTATTYASSYYAAIKRKVPNQYGQINSIRYLDTGVWRELPEDNNFTSIDFFGGDTYITRFTEKRKMTYFLNWPFDVPDGYEWDYRKYYNIPYPRFWVDGTEYDLATSIKGSLPLLGGVVGTIVGSRLLRNNIPSSKHNLDCYRSSANLWTVKDRYFYLFNNGVIDYYAESEYNSDYRDWTEDSRHYDWYTYTNLTEMFRSDKIQFDNKFEFDKVYLKQLTETFIPKQSLLYDPSTWSTCYTHYGNRVIYSLPSAKEQIRDNWLIYPGLNYFDFPKDDGLLTTIKNLEKSKLLFLFDGGSPQITLGVDTLQTDGATKILLGDGGLFVQSPQDMVSQTEYNYGSCESKYSTISTHFGTFFLSQRQGRIFQIAGGLRDISRNGLMWWMKEHLPSKLLKDYPTFIHKDNPVAGVGLISVFDNSSEILYLTKKDYVVKDQWKDSVTYDADKDQWKVRNIKIDFADPIIFEDASWTLSYDPKANEGRGAWVSFHDWHPDFYIQTENHFLTSKDRGLWKHNETCDKYCNFYGIDVPFEIETVFNSGPVSTLSSLEWQLECFEYRGSCLDKYHVLYENFDELIVHTTEQSSGTIKLERRPKTMLSPFPIFDSSFTRSEFSKVEQKYRVNQFWDLTKDRMNGKTLFVTQPNGYRKVVNKLAIDYGKKATKKFRSTYGNVILRKTVSGTKSIQMKLIHEKQTLSLR